MKDVNFEWYVLNERHYPSDHKFNKYPYIDGTIKPFNIFDNVHVYEHTIRLCKQYKTKHMTFDEFKEELRCIIMWQEWSRCEYEIVVGEFPNHGELQKIDCYRQVLPNIDILAMYVLNKYYPRLNIRV